MKRRFLMQDSRGKQAARALFYKEFLPRVLTPLQIRSSAFLLLLGEEAAEIPYCDELHVARNRIYCVERDRSTYHRIAARRLGLKMLTCGELRDFIQDLLRADERIAILNLDIEGNYINGIDPAMTSVIDFCWKNPATVIATYHTVTRDPKELYEGIKSLGLFCLLAPDETEQCFATLVANYRAAGYDEAVNMTLRTFCWLRSQAEHIARASCLRGLSDAHAFRRLMLLGSMSWTAIRGVRSRTLRYSHVAKTSVSLAHLFDIKESIAKKPLPLMGIGFDEFQYAIYRTENQFKQQCYFASFRQLDICRDFCEWVVDALNMLATHPLVAISRDGERSVILHPKIRIDSKAVLRIGSKIYAYEPRILKIRTAPEQHPKSSIAALYLPPGRLNDPLMAPLFLDERKVLTPFGRTYLSILAQSYQTFEVMRAEVPAEVPDKVIKGYLFSTREQEKKQTLANIEPHKFW